MGEKNKWIWVAQELPEWGKVVLVKTAFDQNIALATYDNGSWDVVPYYGVSYSTKTGITHWMKLPEVK